MDNECIEAYKFMGSSNGESDGIRVEDFKNLMIYDRESRNEKE